jgi:ribosomal protein S2
LNRGDTTDTELTYLSLTGSCIESGDEGQVSRGNRLGGPISSRRIFSIEREVEKMEKLFAGIKDMRKMPEAIFIADINHDDIALKEARKMKIKIIGVADSNSNPEFLDYAIPANDDATQAIELVSGVIADAISEGKLSSNATKVENVEAVTTK